MLLGAEKFGNEEINPYFWFSKNNFEKPMKVINLGETDSVLNNIVAQMRDKTVQKDSLRFRYNLERLGHIFAYEISKVLDYSPKDVITPLATAKVRTCDAKIVVSTICAPVCLSTKVYSTFSTTPRTHSSQLSGSTTRATSSTSTWSTAPALT